MQDRGSGDWLLDAEEREWIGLDKGEPRVRRVMQIVNYRSSQSYSQKVRNGRMKKSRSRFRGRVYITGNIRGAKAVRSPTWKSL